MPANKVIRKDLVEDSVFNVGRDFAQSLQPGIESTIQWKTALNDLKEAALAYNKIENEFKISDSRIAFLKLKQEEENLRKKAANSVKAEKDALVAIQKVKQAELDTDRKKEAAEARKQKAQIKAVQLTEQERLEIRLLNRGKREAAVISSRLSTEYEKQAVILTQLRRKYKDVALVEGESSKNARLLQKEITKLDATLKKVDANVGQFQRNVGNYPKQLRAAANAARSFASALGVVGGAFLFAQVVREAINAIREFDKQLIAVQKTTNLSDIEIKQFGKDVVKLGSDLDGISTQGLLKSAEVAGQLGIRGSENILKFSETLEKLTLTSDIAGEESARAFAKFIEVSNDTVDNADRLGSVITELGNNFATTESQILKNTVEIQKGISIYETSAEQVIALGAATNALGSEAEASRGALQTVFKVLNDGATTGKNLDNILKLTGQSVEDFRKEFGNDAIKTFQRFVKGLSDSDKAGLNLSNTLEELGITEKRATAVVGSLAKNYETLEDALNRANQEYEDNTALNEEAAKAAESLDSKIGDLEDAFENLTIGVDQGTGAISVFFKNAIEGLTDFIKGLNTLNTSATEQGVNAARAVVNDFKQSTEIIEGETKGFIVRTIQQADDNIGTLQDRITELKDSFLISEGEDGKLRYFGVDFGDNTLDKIKRLQDDLEKEKSTRDELNKILLEEGRAKDDLAARTAVLAVEAGKRQGNEINLARQIEFFQSLSIGQLKRLNAEYSKSEKKLENIKGSEAELERARKKAAREAERQAKLATDNKNNLDNFRLEQQIEEQKAIVDNQEESFSKRQIALAEQTRIEIELARQQADQKIAEAKGQADAILLIEAQFQARKKAIETNEEETQDGFEIDKLKELSAIAKAETEKRLNQELEAENRAFLAKEGIYANEEKAVETRERRIAEIKRRFALEGLNAQVVALETLIDKSEEGSKERIEAEAKVAKAKADISKLGVDKFIADKDDEVEFEKLTSDRILQISSELASALGDLGNAIFEGRIQKIDDEIEANDAKYERLLENENLSAADRERIEQKQEKQREELERKKRKEQRKQAILDKALALTQIAILTAQGIMQAYAQLGPIAGNFGAVLVGVLGAIQAAAVIAKPIPSYFKGTDNHPGGLALVGEVRPEVIQEPNKDPYIVHKPSVLDLPSGTKVTPSVEEYEQLFRASILSSIEMEDKKLSDHYARDVFNLQLGGVDTELIQEVKQVKKEIKNLVKRPVSFNGKIVVEQPYNKYN